VESQAVFPTLVAIPPGPPNPDPVMVTVDPPVVAKALAVVVKTTA